MKGWLITWNWTGDAASVVDRVIGIVSWRKSSKAVAEIVEFLYAQHTATLLEWASYARNRKSMPYRANIDFNNRISCGHNPFLFAELATDIKIATEPKTAIETISWMTQTVYAPTESGPKRVAPPRADSWTRLITGPISTEEMWDRAEGRFKNEFTFLNRV